MCLALLNTLVFRNVHIKIENINYGLLSCTYINVNINIK